MKIVALMLLLGVVVGGILPGLSRGNDEMRWVQLVAPHEPAIEILGRTREYPATTFFRTEGSIYACGQECTTISKMPDPSKLCKPAGESIRQAPVEVADSLRVACPGGDGFIDYDLVLLKDGRALESIEPISNGFEFIEVLMAGCIGGVVGLIIGIIIIVVMPMRKSPARNSGQVSGQGGK